MFSLVQYLVQEQVTNMTAPCTACLYKNKGLFLCILFYSEKPRGKPLQNSPYCHSKISSGLAKLNPQFTEKEF